MSANRPNWESRFAYIKESPSPFTVTIHTSARVRQALDSLESERLVPKLHEIEKLAAQLALNMVKGTLKYQVDTHTTEEWAAFEEDERIDQINYWLLSRSV